MPAYLLLFVYLNLQHCSHNGSVPIIAVLVKGSFYEIHDWGLCDAKFHAFVWLMYRLLPFGSRAGSLETRDSRNFMNATPGFHFAPQNTIIYGMQGLLSMSDEVPGSLAITPLTKLPSLQCKVNGFSNRERYNRPISE